jgi:hypothetical protein
MYDKKSSEASSKYTTGLYSETGPKSKAAWPPKRNKEGVIVRGRVKAAREMRNTFRTTSDGKKETVRMEWGEGEGKYKYQVNPSIFPEKDGKWKDLGGQGNAAYEEARKRGEVIGFKSKKKAEKFAAGSWKKGKDKKEAMKNYRSSKTNEKAEQLMNR